jgi:hypothetical protein
MTYQQAAAQLPQHAEWSCSFGYPGEGGYVEYHRDAFGNRYVLTNGRYDGPANVWTFEQVQL